MPTNKPTFVPRRKGVWAHDRTLPPAATFEPERWSKSWRVKNGKAVEDDAVYSWSPKPKGFVEQMGEAFKGLLPKKAGKK